MEPRALALLVVALLFCRHALAETHYVDDDAPADFSGIQDAIAAASDGDEIIVRAGRYYENIVIDKALSLRGVDYPVIDVKFKGVALTIRAANCEVRGFTIVNSGRGSQSPGMLIASDGNVVEDNRFHWNDDGAVQCRRASSNTIARNEIHTVGDYGIGISEGSIGNRIIGNELSNVHGSGIFLDGFKNLHGNVIDRNSISSCRAAGVGLEKASRNFIRENRIDECRWGILLTKANSRENEIVENTVTNSTYGIYVKKGASRNQLHENRLEGNETNAVDENGGNFWDTGARGNYWSDYTGSDEDGDGAGEVPYSIAGSAGARDHHPLMQHRAPAHED